MTEAQIRKDERARIARYLLLLGFGRPKDHAEPIETGKYVKMLRDAEAENAR